MNAIRFLKTKTRICRYYKTGCDECPLSSNINGRNVSCYVFTARYPEEAATIVEVWDEAHPAKTRQNELLKIIPDAVLDHGVIRIKPCDISASGSIPICQGKTCDECRELYWLDEIDEAKEDIAER